MLVVFGVAFLVICALLIVIGRLTFTKPTASQSIRSFVTSATYHVCLATFAGMGVVMLLLFVVGSMSLGGVEMVVAAAIAVAGVVGVRVLHRKNGSDEEEAEIAAAA